MCVHIYKHMPVSLHKCKLSKNGTSKKGNDHKCKYTESCSKMDPTENM